MLKTFYFEELESTNDYCKNLVMNFISKKTNGEAACPQHVLLSAGTDIAVIAEIQTAGRGRLNQRTWISVAGNFHGSFVINLEKTGVREQNASLVNSRLLAAIHKFLLNTIGNAAQNRLHVKFPNDILIDKKKLCGLLIEVIYPFAVIGIGINLTNSPLDTSTNLHCEFGIILRPKDVVDGLYAALTEHLLT